jgi:hypothetical protein
MSDSIKALITEHQLRSTMQVYYYCQRTTDSDGQRSTLFFPIFGLDFGVTIFSVFLLLYQRFVYRAIAIRSHQAPQTYAALFSCEFCRPYDIMFWWIFGL